MVAIKALLVSAVLATASYAKVLSMHAPETVQAGQNFTAVLSSRAYIQNWDDFGVIWGLKKKGAISGAKDVGQEISYNNLYRGIAAIPNATFTVPVPASQEAGEYTLVAAVPYLVAAAGYTDIRYFNQSITITD